MDSFDFNRHFSALKERLRNVLNQHKIYRGFKMSRDYRQTIDTAIKSVQSKQHEFNCFVVRKQSEVDRMAPGTIKIKMQNHLNKTASLTNDHFNKLISHYQKMSANK